eukprot:4830213-Karenia_brevis.AAC.1
MLAALIVLQKSFCVRCARKYFLVPHSRSHSGSIDKRDNETLAAMDVFIQNAPIQTVGRVLAATT